MLNVHELVMYQPVCLRIRKIFIFFKVYCLCFYSFIHLFILLSYLLLLFFFVVVVVVVFLLLLLFFFFQAVTNTRSVVCLTLVVNKLKG